MFWARGVIKTDSYINRITDDMLSLDIVKGRAEAGRSAFHSFVCSFIHRVNIYPTFKCFCLEKEEEFPGILFIHEMLIFFVKAIEKSSFFLFPCFFFLTKSIWIPWVNQVPKRMSLFLINGEFSIHIKPNTFRSGRSEWLIWRNKIVRKQTKQNKRKISKQLVFHWWL